ncbi:hypothetical protein CLOM_g3586 [Closterium sp. NIES-68]|nr:hypothetical protein CLOM_g3586 [Closterium sp. NIES-68]GJP63722.1 hypothetical protein CLOP_g20776 [Closterium sp. NIES-67]
MSVCVSISQAYVKSELFPHSPPQCLRQRNRFKALLTVLPALSADFLCVQEMDEYEAVYRQPMAAAGWESVYMKRPGKKRDGSGIFYRSSRFRLLRSQPISFNNLIPPIQQPRDVTAAFSAPSPHSSEESARTTTSPPDSSESRDLCDPHVRFKRDCVAIVAAFQERMGEVAEDGESEAGGGEVREGTGGSGGGGQSEKEREGEGGSGGDVGQQRPGRVVVVASSHIFWDPQCADVKLAQAQYLLQQVAHFRTSLASTLTHSHSCTVTSTGVITPITIICGDFNSLPGDPVYKYLTSGAATPLETAAGRAPEAATPLETAAGRAPEAATPLETAAAVGRAPEAATPLETAAAVGRAPEAATPLETAAAVGRAPEAATPSAASPTAPIPLASLHATAGSLLLAAESGDDGVGAGGTGGAAAVPEAQTLPTNGGEQVTGDLGYNALNREQVTERQVGQEPELSTFNPPFCGTIDYVLISKDAGSFSVESTLWLPSRSDSRLGKGLPNLYFPSDHLPVGGDIWFA